MERPEGIKVKIEDIDCLIFESVRKSEIDTTHYPNYPHVYVARHGDDFSFPCSIEHEVYVNHCGTVLSATPLLNDNQESLEVKKIEYENGDTWEPYDEDDDDFDEDEDSGDTPTMSM